MSQVLTYTINEQDHLLFAEHSRQYQTTTRRWLVILRIVVSVLPLLYCAMQGYAYSSWLYPGLGVVLAVAMFFLWPVLTNRMFRSQVRSALESQGAIADEPQQIWLDDMGLHASGRLGMSVVPIGVITRVDDTPSYVYVYIGPARGVIIPKFKVDPWQLAQFLTELHARLGR